MPELTDTYESVSRHELAELGPDRAGNPMAQDAFDLGRKLVVEREYREAENIFGKVIAADQENAPAYFNRGYCRAKLGDSAAAENDFNKVINLLDNAQEPLKGELNRAYREVGDLLLSRNECQRAKKAYSEALKRSIESKNKGQQLRALVQRARVWVKLGEIEKALEDCRFAISLFERGMKQDPGKISVDVARWIAKAHLVEGIAFEEKGDLGAAVERYTKAIDLESKKYLGGLFCTKIEGTTIPSIVLESKTATEEYWDAFARYAEEHAARFRLAQARFRSGQLELARQDWQEADREIEFLLRRPASYSALIQHRGEAFLKSQEYEKAKTTFDLLAVLNPTNADHFWWSGKVCEIQGQIKDAIERYSASIELRRDCDRLQHLAWILATCPIDGCNDPKLALKLASEANKKSNQQDPLVLETLAAAHANRGRFRAAIRELNRISSLSSVAEIETKQNEDRRKQALSLYKQNKPYRDETLRDCHQEFAPAPPLPAGISGGADPVVVRGFSSENPDVTVGEEKTGVSVSELAEKIASQTRQQALELHQYLQGVHGPAPDEDLTTESEEIYNSIVTPVVPNKSNFKLPNDAPLTPAIAIEWLSLLPAGLESGTITPSDAAKLLRQITAALPTADSGFWQHKTADEIRDRQPETPELLGENFPPAREIAVSSGNSVSAVDEGKEKIPETLHESIPILKSLCSKLPSAERVAVLNVLASVEVNAYGVRLHDESIAKSSSSKEFDAAHSLPCGAPRDEGRAILGRKPRASVSTGHDKQPAAKLTSAREIERADCGEIGIELVGAMNSSKFFHWFDQSVKTWPRLAMVEYFQAWLDKQAGRSFDNIADREKRLAKMKDFGNGVRERANILQLKFLDEKSQIPATLSVTFAGSYRTPVFRLCKRETNRSVTLSASAVFPRLKLVNSNR